MKNRLLTLLSAVLSAGAVSAAAPQQLIDIRTDDVSIVLAAQPGGEVYFRHFGGRIDDPAPLASYKSSRRADHGTDDPGLSRNGRAQFPRTGPARHPRRRGYEYRAALCVALVTAAGRPQRHRNRREDDRLLSSAGCRAGIHGLCPGKRHHHAYGDPQPRAGSRSRSTISTPRP